MQSWAGIAIAQTALIAFSLWRLSRIDDRTVWWPGVAMFVVAALALLVLVRGEAHWTAIALFGTAILASDAIFLGGTLVASLCTRPRPRPHSGDASSEPDDTHDGDGETSPEEPPP